MRLYHVLRRVVTSVENEASFLQGVSARTGERAVC